MDHQTEKYAIQLLNVKWKNFEHYLFYLYATGAEFQQSNLPSGNLHRAKLYYNGKDKLYGHKIEMSILPNRYGWHCSRHLRGSIYDLVLFYHNLDYHKAAQTKTEDEKEIMADVLHSELYLDMWDVIVHKGYQGILETVRKISPKTPKKGSLTVLERNENRNILNDRIIVENFFGRLCSLFFIANLWVKVSLEEIIL